MTLIDEFNWYYKICNIENATLSECFLKFSSENFLVIHGTEEVVYRVNKFIRRLGFSFFCNEKLVFVVLPPCHNDWADRIEDVLQEKYPEIEVLTEMPTGQDFSMLYLKLAITGTIPGKIITSNYREKLLNGTLADKW